MTRGRRIERTALPAWEVTAEYIMNSLPIGCSVLRKDRETESYSILRKGQAEFSANKRYEYFLLNMPPLAVGN